MTDPGEAAEADDCAAETLFTTLVHSLGGGGGGVTSFSASTVQLRAAGEASTFFAASTARTENWCEPTARPEYDFGAVQPVQLAKSSLHSKLEPASLEVKPRLAEVKVVVPKGPLVIEVSGAVVSGGGGGGGTSSFSSSTVQLRAAGEASTFLAASTARTENWCEPTARAEYDFGDAHALQLAESSLHSKLEPGSVEVNAKLAELVVVAVAAEMAAVVGVGPLVMEVSGAVVSVGEVG